MGGPTTSDVGGGNCSGTCGGGGPLMTTGRPGRVMTTEEEKGGVTDVGGEALLKLSVGKGLFGSLVKVGVAAADEDGVTQTLWVVEGGCLWWSIKLWICSDFMS